MIISNRRGFLQGAGIAAMGAVTGTLLPIRSWGSYGLIPSAAAAAVPPIDGKEGLTVLNDRPLNAETPPHLLDDEVTPVARHFVRNNGIVPQDMNPDTWKLRIDGLVEASDDAQHQGIA